MKHVVNASVVITSVMMFSISSAEASSRLRAVTDNLVEEINKYGIESVLHQSLTAREIQILGLIVELVGDNDIKWKFQSLHSAAVKWPGKLKASISQGDKFAKVRRPKESSKIFTRIQIGAPEPQEYVVPANWRYTVRFANETPVLLDEVAVFYKQARQIGVTYLAAWDLVPGLAHTFEMGRCDLMQSYVIGVFMNDLLVFRWPESGVMTSHRSGDDQRCEDSWVIN